MARDEEKRIKLQKEAMKELSDSYKALEAQLDVIYKKKIKEGKATQGQTKEEKELKEQMFKLEDAHLQHIANLNDEEYEKVKDRWYEAEAHLDFREKQIKESMDSESEFWSLSANLSTDAYQAYREGDMERFKLSDDLTKKTIEQADNEDLIGTKKFKTIDHTTRINALAKEEVELQRDLAIAKSTGNKDLEKEIMKKIKNNKHEKTTLETLQKSAEIQKHKHKIITEGLAPLEEMKKKMENFAGIVEGLVANPMVAMVTLAVALVKHFKATEESFEKFRKDLGLAEKEAGKLQTQAMGVAKNMADTGVSLDDALGATTSLVTTFGDMGMATEKNLETVLRMNKALGMSNDEAAKFLKTMTNILGTSVEEAEALAAGATNLARQAGVAPATVIADMSANADSFAAYIKDGGKNLAEAAVFAAKMGTSLATLTKMADHFLDIENSIEKQMEAQVLLGRNINLEKARQFAYDGKIEEMAAEITKQVGSAAEYEKMRPHQRKALAAAMGMEVSELGNMISKQETLQKLADGTLSTQEALADLPLSEVMDAKGITGPITDIQNSIKAIALNLMEVFRPVFSFVAMILKPIAGVLGFIAKLLNNSFVKSILYLYVLWKLINSELVFGYALKVKDFTFWMASQIKIKAMKLWEFAWDKKNWSWKLAKEKLFGGLKANFHKKEMLRKKAEQSMDAKGWKAKIKSMKDRMMGKGKGATGTDATPTTSTPGAGAKGKGSGSFMKSIGKIDYNKVLKGAAAMIIVAGAIYIFAKALQELPTEPGPYIGAAVGLGMLMGAVFLMGKMQGQLIQGSVAMLLMGAAFLPFAFGLSLLTDLDFGAVIAAAGALLIFTGAIFGLGALMMSGVGAVLFGAGIIALTAMGAAMIVFGAGLMIVATAAGMLVEHLSGVATGLTELVAASDGIFSLALGLGALAIGFISLAGSLAILLPFLPLLMILGASGVIGQVLGTAPAEGGGEGGGGEKKQSPAEKDRAQMITLLEQILSKIEQPGEVKMDGKKVGEIIASGGTMGPLVG